MIISDKVIFKHLNYNWLKFRVSGLLFAGLLGSIVGCQSDLPPTIEEAKAAIDYPLDFNIHVKPILSDKCYSCHGPDPSHRKADLRLDTPEGAFRLLKNSGKKAIVAGKPGKSEMIHRIISEDEEFVMPPAESNIQMSALEKAILVKWVEDGAVYKAHWAFEKPSARDIPVVEHQDKVVNEIDNYVFSLLERNGLQPQEEADKETLIRRVTFDLTGLPPSLQEINDFVNDSAPNSYEKVVDRLLASAHYGEKMAADWMDVSRFADTHGYSVDRYRPMWPWRDWVINAFNANQSYKDFVTWQLAGDLMPDPSPEQLIATGFNRNHAQNMEGGIVNEEFRIEYVADRTNTFGKAFLAMTFECARCHDHKFDPISQKEYFQLFSFFNQIDEAGQISWDDAMPVPTMLLKDHEKDSIIQFLDNKIKQQEEKINSRLLTTPVNFYSNSDYRKYLDKNLKAYFDFNTSTNNLFTNKLNQREKAGIYESQPGKNRALDIELIDNKDGKALKLNGDDPLIIESIGAFNRSQPFSIGLQVKIPSSLSDGVIFFKGQGAILYNFRGYHMALRDDKIELLMAHTWPYNNIIKVSKEKMPKDQWVQLTMTYDGSSTAKGVQLYLDGKKEEMAVEKDNLYKDILLPHLKVEPGLQFGARWRGTGIKGAAIDDIFVYDRQLHGLEVALIGGAKEKLVSAEENALTHFHKLADEIATLNELRAEQNEIVETLPEIMIMDELKDKRKTFILDRGAYDAPSEEVEPGAPTSILPFPEDLPANRLGLAKWLFSDENPLTSRVIVNRYWQSYFGQGLVKSAADFGNQGALPSHPELLDWLALSFKSSGWDIKALQKTIVMSAAYRQSSKTSAELLEKDYDNSLISRGPSSRLTAEMLRDNVLFASGLMVNEIGGESVKPYQPAGLWRIGGSRYQQDKGDKQYRRSLYTIWKRTVPPPSMNTFDAPTRSYCVVTRQKTSTPLQSLVLLNDPQFIEAYRALAIKVCQDTEDKESRITKIHQWLTSLKPNKEALKVLADYYDNQLDDFKEDPDKMKGWLNTGDYVLATDVSDEEIATFTVLASMVMNSDAAVTKR